tara:strand:- start:327 stop:488 length:162 start_codon:yes stop_codon:yes gene_type:complete
MRFLLILLLLLLCCAKKEEPLQNAYTPPPIEWTDDLDLDDLPEAGDTAEDEDN